MRRARRQAARLLGLTTERPIGEVSDRRLRSVLRGVLRDRGYRVDTRSGRWP